ncbi:MAG: translation elongation factor 4 [Planctomycetes bacterium]|nr:translation elongation factor 4 [Planctomycetota bacterium]
MDLDLIRNYCIIAHIDHGKSTLADRMLEYTGVVSPRELGAQMLDSMALEKERGITIKAVAVRLPWTVDGKEYQLDLIDTPGHVDFSYEVSRSLAACEGAILLVDCTQGVQAQTVANCYLAIEAGLEVIPVLNKVDLPTSRPEEVAEEIMNSLGLDATEAPRVSGKTGEGVRDLLDLVVRRIPAPKGVVDAPLQALVIDSVYDDYRGIVVYVRLKNGRLKKGDVITLMSTGRAYEVNEVGIFQPREKARDSLQAGEVGYFWGAIKSLEDVKIGDTVTHAKQSGTPATAPLPGYKEPQPMVFAGIYPSYNAELPALRKALEKLHLNDASFTFEPEKSEALGFGFRCGFLGMLHMDVVQERLERESNVQIVQTAPSVRYQVVKVGGEIMEISSPAQLPEPNFIDEIREPMVRAQIITPTEFIGSMMHLNEEKRGKYVKQEHIGQNRVIIVYDVPLAEIIFDYYDPLKSASKGYATLSYEMLGYVAADLVKLNVLVNATPVDALSIMCHRSVAEHRGREMCKRLREEIPRHMFDVPVQAAIGGRIIARETVKALRKDVTAKCYGGDISRKRKLLEKQKEGKKRMKHVGNVEIPQKAFLAVLGGGGDEDKGKKKK